MIETISKINSGINGFIWGIPAMIALMGVGIYLSIRLKFMQIISHFIIHRLHTIFISAVRYLSG